jgi:hypothetical protein
MTGVITDRMSPVSKPNIFLGPPSPAKVTNEPIVEGKVEREFVGSNLNETTDCVVLFINEATPPLQELLTEIRGCSLFYLT